MKAGELPSGATVSVQIAARAQGIPRGAYLRRCALAALGSRAEVTVRVVDAREGRSLNRRYRRKDYATDVLSFAYETGRTTRGDVVLCAPVVSREAREQQKTIAAHYAHLTVHGVLHLRGYDHDTAARARLMENREKRILRDLGFPDPYL
ncbi:MAG: rRNA maturation RNase YbeY [Betaproteobacteria bacterium]|nr:rRNA maturation RNase YbeY [Betaproteobacteria bacterium]